MGQGIPLDQPIFRIQIMENQHSIPTLLVVDDDPDERELITLYLQSENYRIVTAENGMKAWSLLENSPKDYDAIILDVDNGPSGLTRKDNDHLYSTEGLFTAFSALRCPGLLAVWSAGQDPAFAKRLHKAGFAVDEIRIRANRTRGARQIIWLASKAEPGTKAAFRRQSGQCRRKRRNR